MRDFDKEKKERQTQRVRETNSQEVKFLLDRPESKSVSLSFETGRVKVSQGVLREGERQSDFFCDLFPEFETFRKREKK